MHGSAKTVPNANEGWGAHNSARIFHSASVWTLVDCLSFSGGSWLANRGLGEDALAYCVMALGAGVEVTDAGMEVTTSKPSVVMVLMDISVVVSCCASWEAGRPGIQLELAPLLFGGSAACSVVAAVASKPWGPVGAEVATSQLLPSMEMALMVSSCGWVVSVASGPGCGASTEEVERVECQSLLVIPAV